MTHLRIAEEDIFNGEGRGNRNLKKTA